MNPSNRRDFMKATSVAALASAVGPLFLSPSASWAKDVARSANERLTWGVVGAGDRWCSTKKGGKTVDRLCGASMTFGDYAAVCDVDSDRCERAKVLTGGKAEKYEDYRKLLDRQDIDTVVIVTTDHWHTKVAIEAMKAGKDVYCEKPLTLTIEEGRQICQVAKETGRVFQVGTQQRSEYDSCFLKFVALAQSGRLGKLHKATVVIGSGPKSKHLDVEDVPSNLNWDMWLGQAPMVDYREGRCHYTFRWWYEYSGGKMTDWGAHHIDICQWAIDQLGEGQGPTSITPVMEDVSFPMDYEHGMPTMDDRFNTPTKFKIQLQFPNHFEMIVRENATDLKIDNGILLEGENGTLFVSRGGIKGDLADELKSNPLADDAITKLCKGKQPGNHMGNFVECVRDRGIPISDVFSHHRAMTSCHLANIAIRLGRPLTWDSKAETIVGDEEAKGFQSREQRKGYEIKV